MMPMDHMYWYKQPGGIFTQFEHCTDVNCDPRKTLGKNVAKTNVEIQEERKTKLEIAQYTMGSTKYKMYKIASKNKDVLINKQGDSE